MEAKDTRTDSFKRISEEWMETSSKFWENTFKMQTEMVNSLPSMMKMCTDSLSKATQPAAVYNSINKFILSFFSNPENFENITGASEVLPLLISNVASNLMNAFSEVQSNLISSSTRFGREIKGLNPDDFKVGINTIWREMYQSDFQKIFKIPQLGIARNYQEQINQAMDTGNQAMMAFSEFMALLYIPIEKAGTAVSEQYQKMIDDNEVPEDPKAIYNLWVKALEGYFMEILQSPQYIDAMNTVINTISDHKASKGKLISAMLQQFEIPSNIELDDLYKEIYQLKKRLRSLEKNGSSRQTTVSPTPDPVNVPATNIEESAATQSVKTTKIPKKEVSFKNTKVIAQKLQTKGLGRKSLKSAAKTQITS